MRGRQREKNADKEWTHLHTHDSDIHIYSNQFMQIVTRERGGRGQERIRGRVGQRRSQEIKSSEASVTSEASAIIKWGYRTCPVSTKSPPHLRVSYTPSLMYMLDIIWKGRKRANKESKYKETGVKKKLWESNEKGKVFLFCSIVFEWYAKSIENWSNIRVSYSR
jgi:hypothetical protein